MGRPIPAAGRAGMNLAHAKTRRREEGLLETAQPTASGEAGTGPCKDGRDVGFPSP